MPPQNAEPHTIGDVVSDPNAGREADYTKWTTWGFRPIALFAAAHMIVGILHEWTHALTAYAFKVPSTLFHFYAQIDRTTGTLGERAVIRLAGPLFCLGVGLVCWLAYRKAKGSRPKLLLLYLAWFGTATFFGNLMSTAFVGDFSGLALVLQLPMPVRYALSLAGMLSLCGISFLVGTELRKWAPAVGSAQATVGMVILPAIVGTAIVILVHLPMPLGFAAARVAESCFWIFGAVGTWIRREKSEPGSQDLRVGWADFALFFMAVFILRVMAGGIAFVP
jgi:hypothetical protein